MHLFHFRSCLRSSGRFLRKNSSLSCSAEWYLVKTSGLCSVGRVVPNGIHAEHNFDSSAIFVEITADSQQTMRFFLLHLVFLLATSQKSCAALGNDPEHLVDRSASPRNKKQPSLHTFGKQFEPGILLHGELSYDSLKKTWGRQSHTAGSDHFFRDMGMRLLDSLLSHKRTQDYRFLVRIWTTILLSVINSYNSPQLNSSSILTSRRCPSGSRARKRM
jgi:hypothetical protein